MNLNLFTNSTSLHCNVGLYHYYYHHHYSLDIRSVSALEVLRNRAMQIDIYLLTHSLTYLLTYSWPTNKQQCTRSSNSGVHQCL